MNQITDEQLLNSFLEKHNFSSMSAMCVVKAWENFKATYSREEGKGGVEWEILKGKTANGCIHTWDKVTCSSPISACSIYSVRRTSDGTIFTVGDKITGRYFSPASDVRTILKFMLQGSRIIIDQDGGESMIHEIEKAPAKVAVLIITDDNKSLCAGDTYWYVNRLNHATDVRTVHAGLTEGYRQNYLIFSSEFVAKNYILTHQRLLTLDDVRVLMEENLMATHLVMPRLEELVQERISK